jgi:hypothetical protein
MEIRTTSIALGLVLAALSVAPAWADEDEATVETGGPSKTEYAIPLQSARQEAAGGAKDSAESDSGKAPLFGVGVEADDEQESSSDDSGDSAAPKKKAEAKKRVGKTSEAAAAQAPSVLPTAVPASAPSGDAGTSATIGGLAVAVLLLGAVLGSIARRRRAQ